MNTVTDQKTVGKAVAQGNSLDGDAVSKHPRLGVQSTEVALLKQLQDRGRFLERNANTVFRNKHINGREILLLPQFLDYATTHCVVGVEVGVENAIYPWNGKCV